MGQALSRSRLRSRSSEEVLDWCNTVISTTQAVAEYMGPRTTLVAVCDLNSDSGKPEESGRERETGRRIYGASDVQQNLSYFLGIISSTAEGTSAANLFGRRATLASNNHFDRPSTSRKKKILAVTCAEEDVHSSRSSCSSFVISPHVLDICTATNKSRRARCWRSVASFLFPSSPMGL